MSTDKQQLRSERESQKNDVRENENKGNEKSKTHTLHKTQIICSFKTLNDSEHSTLGINSMTCCEFTEVHVKKVRDTSTMPSYTPIPCSKTTTNKTQTNTKFVDEHESQLQRPMLPLTSATDERT